MFRISEKTPAHAWRKNAQRQNNKEEEEEDGTNENPRHVLRPNRAPIPIHTTISRLYFALAIAIALFLS